MLTTVDDVAVQLPFGAVALYTLPAFVSYRQTALLPIYFMGADASHPSRRHTQTANDVAATTAVRSIRSIATSEVRRVFRKIDATRCGFIYAPEFHRYLCLTPTPFTMRVFAVFDEDGDGGLSNADFESAVRSYCPLDKSALLRFSFMLYDIDVTGHIAAATLELIVREMYGQRYASNPLVSAVLHEIGVGGRLHFESFAAIQERHPSLLFPAFTIQARLRAAVLGEVFWAAEFAARARKTTAAAYSAYDILHAMDDASLKAGREEETAALTERYVPHFLRNAAGAALVPPLDGVGPHDDCPGRGNAEESFKCGSAAWQEEVPRKFVPAVHALASLKSSIHMEEERAIATAHVTRTLPGDIVSLPTNNPALLSLQFPSKTAGLRGGTSRQSIITALTSVTRRSSDIGGAATETDASGRSIAFTRYVAARDDRQSVNVTANSASDTTARSAAVIDVESTAATSLLGWPPSQRNDNMTRLATRAAAARRASLSNAQARAALMAMS